MISPLIKSRAVSPFDLQRVQEALNNIVGKGTSSSLDPNAMKEKNSNMMIRKEAQEDNHVHRSIETFLYLNKCNKKHHTHLFKSQDDEMLVLER